MPSERQSRADRKASKDMLKILDYILFAMRSSWKVLSKKAKWKDLYSTRSLLRDSSKRSNVYNQNPRGKGKTGQKKYLKKEPNFPQIGTHT